MRIPLIPKLFEKPEEQRFFQALKQAVDTRVRLEVYTTSQRDAITDWKKGDLIFNSDLDTAQVKISTGWASV